MRTRSDDGPPPVLLHGDLNPTNVLAAAREPWLAIDPKPMLGDAAYDGSRLAAQPDPLAEPDPARIVAQRLDVVADGLGIERGPLVEWCLAAAVQMGTSAAARGDVAASERSAAHVGLLAPHLP
jgi:streptomycin 6-kinase